MSFSDFEKNINKYGVLIVTIYNYLALSVLAIAIAWSFFYSFIHLFDDTHASVEDILLLFIFLEFGAMVSIYFKTSRIPVRFLIYVAITALTRMMIGSINATHHGDVSIMYISGSILILAIAEFILRFGSKKFPLRSQIDEMDDYQRSIKIIAEKENDKKVSQVQSKTSKK